MNLTDRTTKRMRVFKLTDFQTDLLCQSLTRIKREAEPNLTGQWKEDFNKMFNEVVAWSQKVTGHGHLPGDFRVSCFALLGEGSIP